MIQAIKTEFGAIFFFCQEGLSERLRGAINAPWMLVEVGGTRSGDDDVEEGEMEYLVSFADKLGR